MWTQKFITLYRYIYKKAAKFLKYKIGDFPNAERVAKSTLSLPVHEFISKKDILHMSKLINKFYNKKLNFFK